MSRIALDSAQFRAAEYVARLYSFEMTEEDEIRFREWLAESELHRQEYREALALWDKSAALREQVIVEQRPNPFKQYWLMATAAVLMLAIGLAFFVNVPPDKGVPSVVENYVTKVGERKVINLPDGSEVTLNTDSRVMVDYADDQRRLMLIKGQAFFDVVNDESRPFMVDAGERSITALGTKFDVHKSGFDLNVSVLEGTVGIHPGETLWLPSARTDELDTNYSSANEGITQYRVNNGLEVSFKGDFRGGGAEISVAALDDRDRLSSWRYGLIRFDDVSLYDAIRELNRYTTHEVVIRDHRVMDLKVSGIFQVDNIELSLGIFEEILPVKVIRYSDRTVIVGLNTQ